jgi:hypothetical protein
MSIGKVTVWYMTEEERQAYIKKHPIVPSENVKGTTFATVTEMQYTKAVENRVQSKPNILDSFANDIHRLFMEGNTQLDIAKKLNINASTLNNFIYKQRIINPEKWPYRAKK